MPDQRLNSAVYMYVKVLGEGMKFLLSVSPSEEMGGDLPFLPFTFTLSYSPQTITTHELLPSCSLPFPY